MKMALLLSLPLLLAVAPALAQAPKTAAPSDTVPSAKDRALAIDKMRGFAQCVVRGDKAMAQQLLATPSGSAAERAVMLRITNKRNLCLGRGKLRMQGVMMRGALAEQLYLQVYPAPLIGVVRPDAPIAAEQSTEQPYHAFAGCIVMRNAPGADAVLRAPPGSVEEKSAFSQTMPTLSSCLAGGDGTKLTIDRTALRGFLAEALYASRSNAG